MSFLTLDLERVFCASYFQVYCSLQKVSICGDADCQDDKPKWTNFPAWQSLMGIRVGFFSCSSGNGDIRKRTSKIGSGKQWED